jgi:hypothetical protein
MRIRSETVNLLTVLDGLNGAFSVAEAAARTGQREEGIRNTLHRYAEAGLLNCYRQTVNVEHKTGPKNIHFFTLTNDARQVLQDSGVKPNTPRMPRRVINSVFSLGLQ